MTFTSIRYTRHAERMLSEREIERRWVEETLDRPDDVAEDSREPGLMRSYRAIKENGARWLRVVWRREGGGCVVVTTFFDRKYRR